MSAAPGRSVIAWVERARRGVILALCLAAASGAQAQTSVRTGTQTGGRAAGQSDAPANGQSNLQSAGAPRAPLDPAAAAAALSGSAFPGIPPATPPIYRRLPAPVCAEFEPVANGGWAALGPIQFPGPRGPVQMVIGQTVIPGDYLAGMDLGSILQRDCPRTLTR